MMKIVTADREIYLVSNARIYVVDNEIFADVYCLHRADSHSDALQEMERLIAHMETNPDKVFYFGQP